MGYLSEYGVRRFSFEELTSERKKQLKKIAELRQRDVLVYASDPRKNNVSVSISPEDLLPFTDQLSFIKSNAIDIILETPGGMAETVEDMVNALRSGYEKVGIIIPGMAKSAGTIFTMAGDEILMNPVSALGPIDAQIISNGKRFSADAFLDGLEKIKQEVLEKGRLNPAYIPILQNISPGEIQHFENAQNLSRELVTKWLKAYKFKYWTKRNSTGENVTEAYKESRAKEIASKLCKHSDWLSHGRSIRIADLEEMKLLVTDYSKEAALCEAIDRYYALLRLTFDMTGIYKIFETCDSQIYKSVSQNIPPAVSVPAGVQKENISNAFVHITCPNCNSGFRIQLNLKAGVQLQENAILYPSNDLFVCPKCAAQTDVRALKLQVESQIGLKVVLN